MSSPIDPTESVQSVRRLAFETLKSQSVSTLVQREALARIRKPVDYMRCAEFTLALKQLFLKPHMKVLDVGSPQWFSLYLADMFPETQFFYVNILESELSQIRDTAKCLGIDNISYYQQDVRSLEFDSDYFDKAISISVIEHIDPEVGGDILALNEVSRVLVEQGELTLSVPLKDRSNVVCVDGSVYGRSEKKDNFFAREYSFVQFQSLLCNTNFLIKEKSFIVEQPGLLALDFWEWGPGKTKVLGRLIPKSVKLAERVLKKSIEDKLAVHYLKSSPEIQYRVVNIVATLENSHKLLPQTTTET